MNTIKAWISVLETSYLVTVIPAHHPDTRKQAVKTGKLHFLDSGLACHLLGIHDPGQLALHPLRSAIFESWLVAEVLKARLNRGLLPECHHYREARGAEVDLLVRGAKGWLLVEAKSGQTVHQEFLGHLQSLSDNLGSGGVAGRRLVYGGEEPTFRSGVAITPWRTIQKVDWD